MLPRLVLTGALMPLLALPGPLANAATPVPPRCADAPPTGPGNGNSTVFDGTPGWHRQTAWTYKREQAGCAWQGGWYTTTWSPMTSTFVPDAVTMTTDKSTFTTIGAPPYGGSSSLVLVGRMTLTFTPGPTQNACPSPSLCGPSIPMVDGSSGQNQGQWPGTPETLASTAQAVGVNRDTNTCKGYPTPNTCTYFVIADKNVVDAAPGGTVTVYVAIPWGYDPTINRSDPNANQNVDIGNTAAIAIQVTGSSVITPIVVNSVGDQPLAAGSSTCSITGAPDTCTLRAALELVNTRNTPQRVSFAIPGDGVPTIAPATPLPKVATRVDIDASSQPAGWVQLSGASAGANADGLEVDGASSTVRGFVVNGFAGGAGIVAGGSGQTIAGNRVGTNPAGTAAVPNKYGIVFHGPRAIVGGTTGTSPTACTGDCNLVGGNSAFQIGNADTAEPAYAAVTVQGNWVGVDATGAAALPGTGDGVVVALGPATVFESGDAIAIGGSSPAPGQAPGNVVVAPVASDGSAIVVGDSQDGPTVDGNVAIAGNLVGENRAGTAALGGGGFGIFLSTHRLINAPVVGGDDPGSRNVVGGRDVGIFIDGGALIAGNFVGTNLAGTAAVGNEVGIQPTGQAELRGNLVSGNDIGIEAAHANLTRGNVVGLDATGGHALPNDIGIGSADRFVQGATVGGDPVACTANPCNVISGNTTAGIRLNGDGANTLELAGTYVGTDITGTEAVPNGVGIDVRLTTLGVRIGGASDAVSGGGCTYPCNVIAGNTGAGIWGTTGVLAGESPFDDSRIVTGNYLGVNAEGEALPNGGPQVTLARAGPEFPAVVVGGDARRGNFIATPFTSGTAPAVSIEGTAASYPLAGLSSNVYHVPEPAAAIRRPVPSVVAPQLAAPSVDGSSVVVTGTTNVTADPSEPPEQIEIYAVSSCDAAGTYRPVAVGSAAKLDGTFSIAVPAAALAGRTGIYALRTDQEGSTSAFSSCAIGPTITTTTKALPRGGHELDVGSNAGWSAGDYAQVNVTGHPTVRRVSAIGSLVFAAPLAYDVPVGTTVVRLAAPRNDTAGPRVKVKPKHRTVSKGTKLKVKFSCSDGTGVGVEKCPPKRRLPTSKLGKHHVVLEAWDRNGNLTKVRVVWRVVRSDRETGARKMGDGWA